MSLVPKLKAEPPVPPLTTYMTLDKSLNLSKLHNHHSKTWKQKARKNECLPQRAAMCSSIRSFNQQLWLNVITAINKFEQNPVAQRRWHNWYCLEELDGCSGKAGSTVQVEAGKEGWAQIWCTWSQMGNCVGKHFLNCKMNVNICYDDDFFSSFLPLPFPSLL